MIKKTIFGALMVCSIMGCTKTIIKKEIEYIKQDIAKVDIYSRPELNRDIKYEVKDKRVVFTFDEFKKMRDNINILKTHTILLETVIKNYNEYIEEIKNED